MSILVFKHVNFSYRDVPVLTDVNFEVNAGEFVSVIGPNGGGKTTLARLILGLAHPTQGDIQLFGVPPSLSRRRVGYVPQYTQFDPQFPISVLDVILMGRMRRGIGFLGKKNKDYALSALEQVGLQDHAGFQFSSLSGGQRQRVLIARALVSEPEILLLDEPTSNVDIAVEDRLSSMLESFAKSMTVILITHDLGFVSHLVTNLLCVNETVRFHPTYEVTSEMIHSLYEGKIRMVDHGEAEKGHM
ncbi:MAG: ABC transporter ATP-binding protein [Spirochaetales bacterium]|jgi:zinc transport system ATP-binding protein|nr:ABC transporter ATP-binding protein [Spirochaetales bacterium]